MKNKVKKVKIAIPAILAICILALTMSSASAHPRTFDGNVYYADGTPCTAIDLVEIINTNTSETWNQSTLPTVIIAPGWNIYQLTIDEPNDVNPGNIMMYYAASGSLTNTSNCTFLGSGVTTHDIYLDGTPTPSSDLTVTSITSNYDCSGLIGEDTFFGPEPGPGARTQCNNISVTIEELEGVDVTQPFNVSFEVDGAEICSERVSSLGGSASEDIYCDCSFYPYAGTLYNLSVTVDADTEVTETDETNNVMWKNRTAIVNGYKGDGWQSPDKNLTNVQCHDEDTINLTYSVGDSYRQSGYGILWSVYKANWTASDLPVPAGATIDKARLYVYYEWDRTPDATVYDNFTLNINGVNISRDTVFNDGKGFGGYAFPSGLVTYDVINEFDTTVNNVTLYNNETTSGYRAAITGMLMIVVYNHPDEPERAICIDEGYDILYAKDSFGVSSKEATTYANFECCEPLNVGEITNATLITVAPHASDGDDLNRLYFNTGEWHGVWDSYAGETQLSIKETDVSGYLEPTDNTAAFQSHIPAGGSVGDYMEASNAILVLEKVPCLDSDLTVTSITPNYDCSGLISADTFFGPEPGPGARTQCNNISATIEELEGVGVTQPFNITFEVNGAEICSERVPSLGGSASKEIYCNCSFYPYAGTLYNLSVTVDTDAEVTETDETNNTLWKNRTASVNGYKGDGWQSPDKNLTNVQCHDHDTINLTYSVGDSYRQTGYNTPWTVYTANWTASDLPVPAGATIDKARLYVYYEWDRSSSAAVYDNNFTLNINGVNITRDTVFNDRKGFGGYDFPSGLITYDVIDVFDTTVNNVTLYNNETTTPHHAAITGMLMIVVYNHPDEAMRIICINEGYDALYAKDSYGVTSEEATTYATFECCEPLDISKITNATLITVAPHASDGDDLNRLYFNTGEWHGIWDSYAGATQLGINETDVMGYLEPTDNTAAFQSHIPAGGSVGDYMEASNAILVLEEPSEPVVSCGDSVLFKTRVGMATRALGEPDNKGALMRRNSVIAIELNNTIPNCAEVTVRARRVAWLKPHFDVSVSSDGVNWTEIGSATCNCWLWKDYKFTGNWENVKYIKITKPAPQPRLMGLDAVCAEGWS